MTATTDEPRHVRLIEWTLNMALRYCQTNTRHYTAVWCECSLCTFLWYPLICGDILWSPTTPTNMLYFSPLSVGQCMWCDNFSPPPQEYVVWYVWYTWSPHCGMCGIHGHHSVVCYFWSPTTPAPVTPPYLPSLASLVTNECLYKAPGSAICRLAPEPWMGTQHTIHIA